MKITWDLPRIRVNSIYLVHVVDVAGEKSRRSDGADTKMFICVSPFAPFIVPFWESSLPVSILSDEVSHLAWPENHENREAP
jgi:hypothetical protein